MMGEMCLEMAGLLAHSESDRLWHTVYLFLCAVAIDYIDTGFLNYIIISSYAFQKIKRMLLVIHLCVDDTGTADIHTGIQGRGVHLGKGRILF